MGVQEKLSSWNGNKAVAGFFIALTLWWVSGSIMGGIFCFLATIYTLDAIEGSVARGMVFVLKNGEAIRSYTPPPQ